MDTDVVGEVKQRQNREGLKQSCLSVFVSVSLELGVNLRLKNVHWLHMMHNREGLESTKKQTVWWSTKTCSSGAH